MKRTVVILFFLLTAWPSAHASHPLHDVPDPYDGIIIVDSPENNCTGFNFIKSGRKVRAYTAYHCFNNKDRLKRGVVFTAIDVQTDKPLGKIKFICAKNDVAMIEYETDADVKVLPITMSFPPRGAGIWHIGAGFWTPEEKWTVFPVAGVWIGTPLASNEGTEYQAFIPILKGWSGGPVLYHGVAFGIATTGYLTPSPMTGVSPLNVLPRCAD